MKIKLGIIREGKIPVDRRVPFTPEQTREIAKRFPDVDVLVQESSIRCFKDEEYREAGSVVTNDLKDCDIIMGIKEVPVSQLLNDKTYLFFSHTMKEQPYNRTLLQTVLKRNIRLIDYEVLCDANGNRLVAFGRYAGIVGTYNGLWTYGKRYNLFDIKRAHECFDREELKDEYDKIKLPPIKIVLTGTGRVGRGACEVLQAIGIQEVEPDEFLSRDFSYPIFTLLGSADYHRHKEGKEFNRKEFHQHPERFESTFLRYAFASEILIAGAYWNPQAPKLFSKEDMKDPRFKIRVIADISCDINGSVPATVQATNVEDPIYDFDPFMECVKEPFSDDKNITVMAIDNLPCELPRSASRDFGQALINKILPALLIEDTDGVIAGATIAENGKLTQKFSYLSNYVGSL